MNTDTFINVKKKKCGLVGLEEIALWVIHKTDLMRLMRKWLPNYIFLLQESEKGFQALY